MCTRRRHLQPQENEWFEVMEEIAVGAPANEHLVPIEAPGLHVAQ